MKFIIGPLVYLFPQTFWLWTLPDEVYSRHSSCELNAIYTLLFHHYKSFKIYSDNISLLDKIQCL